MSDAALTNLMLFAINLVMMVFIAVFLAITPIITRKSLLFGVRIPESAAQLPAVKAVKRRFITGVSLCGAFLVAVLTAQYLLAPELSLLACLYFPIFMLMAQFLIFIPCWRQALSMKREQGWQAANPATAETQTAYARGRLVSFPITPYLIAIGLLLIATAWSLSVYPGLPERIPTHWNIQMQPDAWADKSLWVVLSMPLVSIATILLLAVSNGAIYRTKLQISPENPRLSYAQHRMYRKMMNHALGFLTVCLSIFFSILQLMSVGVLLLSSTGMMVATGLLIAASIVPFLYITLKAGQGGCKLDPPAAFYPDAAPGTLPLTPVPFDRSDDRYWKFGLFYYNPEDPAILVEDRFGTNGGMNYARPAALVFVAVMLLILLATYIGTTVLYFQGAIF